MYDNENRENRENHGAEQGRGELEPTVNWTTPASEFRTRAEEQRTEEQRAEQQRTEQKQEQRWEQEFRYIRPETDRSQSFGREPYTSVPPKKKQRHGWAKKAAGVTAAALLFGTVAGGVMTGIHAAGNRFISAYGAETEAAAANEGLPSVTAPAASGQTTPVSTVTDVSAIAEAAMPSIVAINDTITVQQRDFFGMPQTYQTQSSGSGIIVGQNDTELLIATNNHVVDGASDLKVTFTDGKDVAAAVKGTDSATDLAIIAVQLSDISSDTMSKIKVAVMGNSDDLKVGQQVIAIGNALGYGQSVTVGYISALDREIQDESGITRTFIQTDAAINPGNSGGALIDLNGNVIGINAAKTASTEVEGMGFAIPSNKAQEILSGLMTKKTRIAVEESAQGYLGIQGTNIDANTSEEFGMPVGIYVYKIVEGGAAASSELQEKDIITKFDGQSVTNMEELKRMLTYYEGGSSVSLTVQSLVNGAYVEHEVEITLGTKPASQS